MIEENIVASIDNGKTAYNICFLPLPLDLIDDEFQKKD
jgi:hypothetical protein